MLCLSECRAGQLGSGLCPVDPVLLPSGNPWPDVSCDTGAWPLVPCLSPGAEKLLSPMDFSFVELAESMFCFCLPRHRSWISTFFPRCLSLCVPVCVPVCVCLSLTFPHTVCPSETAALCQSVIFRFPSVRIQLGTSKLTLTRLFFNLISKPTGHLNSEVFIYTDTFPHPWSNSLAAAEGLAEDPQNAGKSRAGVPLWQTKLFEWFFKAQCGVVIVTEHCFPICSLLDGGVWQRTYRYPWCLVS